VSCCKGCIGAAGMGVVAMIGSHGAFQPVVLPFDLDMAPRRAGSLLVVYASGKVFVCLSNSSSLELFRNL